MEGFAGCEYEYQLFSAAKARSVSHYNLSIGKLNWLIASSHSFGD